jgi:serine/threonine-protein kinase
MHGVIKPLNILLENENTPKIIDFMFIDLNKLEKTRMARPDFSVSQHSVTSDMGTIGYMDKEQKEKGIVTPQTEIYSLGITLFEIFSPKEFSVFQEKLFSNGFLGLPMGDTGLRLVYDELTNYNPLLSPQICQIILKCIQNNENRYKSVAELITDLKHTQQKRSLWTFFRKIFGFK